MEYKTPNSLDSLGERKPEMNDTLKSEYMEDILSLAKEVAEEMIRSGEDMREVQFGHESGTIFISKDPDKVVWTESLVVNGEKFYIGLSEK